MIRELLKQYIILALLILIAVSLYYFFISKFFSEHSCRKKLHFYLTGITAGYLVFFIIAQLSFRQQLLIQYCFHLCIFGMAGITYAICSENGMTGGGNKLAQSTLVVLSILIGLICLLAVQKSTKELYFYYPMLTSILGYLISISFYHTYLYMMLIPGINYRYWTFPSSENVPVVTDADLHDPLVIGFRIQKQHNIPFYTYFRAKAPIKMDLGYLFYHFVNDYNERHPETQIEFSDANNDTSKWIFYCKTYFFSIRILDPDKAVFMNRIKENRIIFCKRIC